MKHSLLIVEGVHDAAFIGHLLCSDGFKLVRNIESVPEVWLNLIPKVFPSTKVLGHVVKYPDIYENDGVDGATIAIIVAGDVNSLVSELQASLEIVDLPGLYSAAIIADADEIGPVSRFIDIVDRISTMNESVDWRSVGGSPLELPETLEEFGPGVPRFGVFILPDKENFGTLETLLSVFSAEKFPLIDAGVKALITDINEVTPAGATYLKAFRKGAGRAKAHVSIVGNFLSPGSSLAVALTKADWLPSDGHEKLSPIKAFLSALFK